MRGIEKSGIGEMRACLPKLEIIIKTRGRYNIREQGTDSTELSRPSSLRRLHSTMYTVLYYDLLPRLLRPDMHWREQKKEMLPNRTLDGGTTGPFGAFPPD